MRHRLVADRSLGVDPLDRRGGQPGGLDLGDGPPVRLAKEGRLERQVDGARRHVAGELLRLLVVFEQRHGERQGDPGRQRVSARRPASD